MSIKVMNLYKTFSIGILVLEAFLNYTYSATIAMGIGLINVQK